MNKANKVANDVLVDSIVAVVMQWVRDNTAVLEIELGDDVEGVVRAHIMNSVRLSCYWPGGLLDVVTTAVYDMHTITSRIVEANY